MPERGSLMSPVRRRFFFIFRYIVKIFVKLVIFCERLKV